VDSDDGCDSDSQDSETDLGLNVIGDDDSDGDEENDTFVPPLRTVTRHGRVAGSWRRLLVEDDGLTSYGDEEMNKESDTEEVQSLNRRCTDDESDSCMEVDEDENVFTDSESEIDDQASTSDTDVDQRNENSKIEDMFIRTRSGRIATTWKSKRN
jgi:hypothetical protein